MTIVGDRWTACCHDVIIVVMPDGTALFASADCTLWIENNPVLMRTNHGWAVQIGPWQRPLPPIPPSTAASLLWWALDGYTGGWIGAIGVRSPTTMAWISDDAAAESMLAALDRLYAIMEHSR